MKKYYYDLHIHSCLSPCGDNDSTPDSIAGMGELNGLDIMALTDHNSTKNCPAFFEAAKHHGIIAVGGMELTTAEDIHLVCLFPTLDSAMAFGTEVEKRRIKIKNRPEIFGDQFIMNSEDQVIGLEEDLLINATDITVDEAPLLAEKFGGVCYPAHIDRESNGIIAVLGAFPETPDFPSAELHDGEKLEEYLEISHLKKEAFIVSSDAHNLWSIKERTDFLELAESEDEDLVRQRLIEYLRCKK
ncbi:MAG: PHP domain-containing protein [Clostridia bacterium]|nr:PHP domain-containing protein [Clostridia bacterium]